MRKKAVFFWFLGSFFHAGTTTVFAQAPPTPAPAQAPAGDPRLLFEEAGKAFTEKNYKVAAEKISQLLPFLTDPNDERRELLLFNLGVANLLDGKPSDAEKAFRACASAFPQGEYASRAYLGLGKSVMAEDGQGDGRKTQLDTAIKAFRRAALDPKFRAEAGLALGLAYQETGQKGEALKVFKSLMGSDVRTPAQTVASVETIGLLAGAGQLESLVAYVDRLITQAGVRDALTWYVNELIVKGDEVAAAGNYEAALAIYRSIPPRAQIVATQNTNLAERKVELAALKQNLAKIDPKNEKNAVRLHALNELIASYEGLVSQVGEASAAFEKLTHLDAMMLLRRGRCFFYMGRMDEALICFSTLREKYPEADDAQNASFAEIIIHNKLKNIDRMQPLGDAYLRKYPDAANAEQVATLVGELLAQSNDWSKVRSFYQDLEKKYPNSPSIDRFTFFQGVAMFQNGEFQDAGTLFEKFITSYPQSDLLENAVYRVAMSFFLTNNYKKTLQWCREYLNRFPEGTYSGDVVYRLAFIDSQDREADKSNEIIQSLSGHLAKNPEDPAAGPMLTLLADTYKKLKPKGEAEIRANETKALDAYSKAVWTPSTDDIIQYALESSTSILQSRGDWQGIADLHGRFMNERSDNQMAMLSATWVAKAMQRLNKPEEGARLLAETLAKNIADPSREQIELLINEIVRNLVPKRRPPDFDPKPVEDQLVTILEKATSGKESTTTFARINYARAQLYDMLRNQSKSEFYLKSIANNNEIQPSALSPMLLAVCADILVKQGDLERAEKMFQRLADRYQESAFSDAGPVGLGQIALARKEYDKAYKIFEDALVNNPGSSRFKEATIGKLTALRDMGKFDEAEKLALEIAGDKSFRGPSIAKAYIILADVFRLKADKETGPASDELLKKAHGYYQRVYTAYQRETELCAEAYFKAYQTLKLIGNQELADKTLADLKEHPKLKDTQFGKKAQTE